MKICFRLIIALVAVATGSMPIVAMAEMPCSGYENPDGENEVNLSTSRLKETSGLVVSRSNPTYLWAHNDSDGNSSLFLVNREGTIVKTFYTQLTANIDWEDIAIGPCEPWSEKNCIYVADTGDNLFTRTDKRVFMMEEPDVSKIGKVKNGQVLNVVRTWNIKYPDTGLDASSEDPEILKFVNPDAESIMVRPGSAEVYIISKQSSGGEQTLFEMTRGGENAGQLNKIASYEFTSSMGTILPLVNATTGADFHPNGYRFVIRTYAMIFEYDLTEYPDIAEAFMHPVERFESFPSVEIQGEAVAYDLEDGVSLITASEGREGSDGKMHFYKCINNPDYVEPEPILSPDPLPEYDPEPDPVIGCPDEKYHPYLERCEKDTITRCNDHDYVCADHVENWKGGYCKYNRCIVSKCAEGSHIYTNGLDLNSDPNYESQCEANTLENCGAHGRVCAELVEHWADGQCTEDGNCVASACVDGSHLVDGACVEDDVDNCGEAGNRCASQIDHWADGKCIDKTCFVTECEGNFHPFEEENICEEDSVEQCGSHGTSCSQAIEGWLEGICQEHQCIVQACVEPKVVEENACVAPNPDEPGPDEPGPDEPGPDEPGPDEPGPENPGSVDPASSDPTTEDDESKFIYATDHACSAHPMLPSNPISGILFALLGMMGLAIRRKNHRNN